MTNFTYGFTLSVTRDGEPTIPARDLGMSIDARTLDEAHEKLRARVSHLTVHSSRLVYIVTEDGDRVWDEKLTELAAEALSRMDEKGETAAEAAEAVTGGNRALDAAIVQTLRGEHVAACGQAATPFITRVTPAAKEVGAYRDAR